MVDEFSAFARMPAPSMQPEDIVKLVEQAAFLQRTAHHEIEFKLNLPREAVLLACDSRQVVQALTNLILNGIESIEGRHFRDGPQAPAGVLELNLRVENGSCKIEVMDNGKGLPKEHRSRLTEPYVTTRERGTGLGLAIVRKIMEDHGGSLDLEDRPSGGAIVSLVFPLRSDASESGGQSSVEILAPKTEMAAGNG